MVNKCTKIASLLHNMTPSYACDSYRTTRGSPGSKRAVVSIDVVVGVTLTEREAVIVVQPLTRVASSIVIYLIRSPHFPELA